VRRTFVLALALFGAAAGIAPAPAEASKKPIDVCAMLSANDVRGWFGKDMTPQLPPIPIPGAPGCDWNGSDDALLTVRLIPANYYEDLHGSRNYERVTGIGDKANVASVLNGWSASAVKGRIAAKVQVFGGKSNRAPLSPY
jgi:hypothetical protein